MMNSLAIEDGLDTIKHAMDAASIAFDVSHFGITGFCMGGTFALRAACELEGLSAAAPFYGDVPEEEVLKKLTVPTIFISGPKMHGSIPKRSPVSGRVRNGSSCRSVRSSTMRPAFFNDTRPEVYDRTAADDAWQWLSDFSRTSLNRSNIRVGRNRDSSS